MKGSTLQSSILKHLKDEGAIAHNIISASPAGCPDILAVYRGYLIAIEVKGKGDTLKTLQHERLVAMSEAGALAMVATSLKQVQSLLKDIDSGRDFPVPYLDAPSMVVPVFTI